MIRRLKAMGLILPGGGGESVYTFMRCRHRPILTLIVRSFQTSSEESYEKGQKESPTISEGSGRSKVSGSSEERALDAAAKFLSDLSGVEGGGAEMLKEGEVDNEAKLR